MDYAIKIVEQSGKDLTDYQIRVEITDLDFFDKCTDQKYVEFYDEDKQTLLSHYTELFDTANKIAIFWVKVPSIPANGTKYIYLNINTERTEDLSNPYNVFDHYEDFEDQDLSDFRGATEPLEIASDDPAEGSYYLKVNGNHANQFWVQDLPQTFGRGIVMEGYAKHIEEAGAIRWGIFESWNGDINTSPQGYWVNYRAGTGEVQLGEPDYEAPTRVTATGESGYNVWRKFKLIIKDNQVVLEFAGVTLTLDSTTFSNFSMWGGYTYRTAGYDHIRIRKYTDPEPSVTVIKLGATPTYELKLKIAQALAGEATTILDTDPKIRLLSGTDIIKELSLTAKTVYKDATNNCVVVAFLFVDDSSDEYTTDNQELLFTKDSTEYVAFKSSKSFTKVADKRLPLRWEIYLPYDVDVCTYEETMISCL